MESLSFFFDRLWFFTHLSRRQVWCTLQWLLAAWNSTNSPWCMFHLTSWGIIHGRLTWLRTMILPDIWVINWNFLFTFLVHAFNSSPALDQMFSVPAFIAAKRRYLKRPVLKSPASLFELPERATASICCVTLPMVNWWKSNLAIGNASSIGVWNAGQGRTQKAKNDSFAVRFCQHNSEPIRIHHSTFDYVIPLFLTCQKKTQSIIAQ